MDLTKRDVPTKPATPELDKMAAAIPAARVVGEFYDWLATEGIVLCSYVAPSAENGHEGSYYPVHIPAEELLRRWKGIDSDKIEQERQALMEYLRALQ